MAFHLVHRFSGQQIAGFLPFDKMAQGREHPTRLKINGEIGIMKSLILLKEVKVKEPPLLLDHGPAKNTNFEFDLVALDRDLPPYELSISGTLFQIHVEQSDICDQTLVLSSETDSSLSHIKDFFQTTMTQGVDSLSQFLIKEFERIIANKHGED
ncbi:unnamed protein product [Cuscuta europaea]|uniref:Uncharacterized protein n=1 Tax=Cuscuta europaea TaxID=41803 RepID=A0A9P1E6L7_CUSEU|nr:unnamed protein product [Cuscuta europaea]